MYFSQQEYDDFELMLDVCRQVGVEPLIVIQPVKGKAYDQTIYTREVREAYYTTIRAICDRMGAEVADFRDMSTTRCSCATTRIRLLTEAPYIPRLSMTFGRANHGDLGINS